VKQKPKRPPRGKMKPVAPEMTKLASDIRSLKEFYAYAAIAKRVDPVVRNYVRDDEEPWIAQRLLEAAKRGELSEVVRAIKRLPQQTVSQRHVRLAYLSLWQAKRTVPTFKALMQRLHERADGKTDCVPSERTVRYIVKILLRLPLTESKTGRRFAVKRVN
jgi:hypothetical protein